MRNGEIDGILIESLSSILPATQSAYASAYASASASAFRPLNLAAILWHAQCGAFSSTHIVQIVASVADAPFLLLLFLHIFPPFLLSENLQL